MQTQTSNTESLGRSSIWSNVGAFCGRIFQRNRPEIANVNAAGGGGSPVGNKSTSLVRRVSNAIGTAFSAKNINGAAAASNGSSPAGNGTGPAQLAPQIPPPPNGADGRRLAHENRRRAVGRGAGNGAAASNGSSPAGNGAGNGAAASGNAIADENRSINVQPAPQNPPPPDDIVRGNANDKFYPRMKNALRALLDIDQSASIGSELRKVAEKCLEKLLAMCTGIAIVDSLWWLVANGTAYFGQAHAVKCLLSFLLLRKTNPVSPANAGIIRGIAMAIIEKPVILMAACGSLFAMRNGNIRSKMLAPYKFFMENIAKPIVSVVSSVFVDLVRDQLYFLACASLATMAIRVGLFMVSMSHAGILARISLALASFGSCILVSALRRVVILFCLYPFSNNWDDGNTDRQRLPAAPVA